MAYNLHSILQSLAADLADEVITLEDAALELYEAGWTESVDEEKAERLLRSAGKEI